MITVFLCSLLVLAGDRESNAAAKTVPFRQGERMVYRAMWGYIPAGEAVIETGGVTHVLPLNEGLHMMEAVGGKAAISIHIYGQAIRKGYIQQFDPHHHAVHRVYPPHLHKKVLAMRVLCCIPESWSENVLKEVLQGPGPDFIAQEAQRALETLQHLKGRKLKAVK